MIAKMAGVSFSAHLSHLQAMHFHAIRLSASKVAKISVPDEIKHGTYFLCVEVGSELGDYLHFIGAGFFIQEDTQYQKDSYLVTARHVIEQAKAEKHKRHLPSDKPKEWRFKDSSVK